MLTCLPQSLCTWDYRVLGTSAGPAALTFNFLTEQGGISLGAEDFAVRKHGPLSGRWTLEHEGRAAADAQKPAALFREFEVQFGDVRLTVKAQSAFTRAYDILADGRPVGTIRPAHALTRRAFVECDPRVPEAAQLFAFWLAVITWRRAANNNAGAT